ncbi:HAD family phosphatase [Dactylosporangium sp. NPDC005555]|uniref:HAD family hydrolase n=1 Tax=Dactylosporangium sp. NPDC005555 TaxID=3154889 RepID=UPI0033AE03CF
MALAIRSDPVVLFDLDGTLIDSEPIWGAANRGLARSRRMDVTEELLISLSGLDSTLAMRHIHEQLGWVDHDIERDVAFVQREVRKAYTLGVHWLPGARRLLAEVRREGFRVGLVTSTYRELVQIVIDEVGADAFDVVVCGDDGHAPKPDPAPYRSAIRQLGVTPSACVAVEDSPRGVASAEAAGCRVLRVCGVVHGDLGRTRTQVRSLTEVGAEDLRLLLPVAAQVAVG